MAYKVTKNKPENILKHHISTVDKIHCTSYKVVHKMYISHKIYFKGTNWLHRIRNLS